MIIIVLLLNKCFLVNDDHLALYYRAKAYKALREYDQALNDATRVITLKPQWAKVRVNFNDDENTNVFL